MWREIFLIFPGSTCRLFILIVWLIKSLLANSFSLFIIHATRASGLIWWDFYTHGSQRSLSPAARGDAGGEHGPNCDLSVKDGRAVSGLDEWSGWWRGAEPLTGRFLQLLPLLHFRLALSSLPHQTGTSQGLRPNRLIYVTCIINTKRLALLPSGSVGVNISKVPGFAEGRCSGPSTPDFRTKRELSPRWGELLGAGALTPQIQRDSDQTARFTFNSDYVNMLVVSQTKHGTPGKLSAAALATIVIQIGSWASSLMRWTMFWI